MVMLMMDAGRRRREASAPPPDLLTGYQEIADHLGWEKRQVEHRATQGEIPTFKIGRSVCARRSTLDAHFAQLEEAARGKHRKA